MNGIKTVLIIFIFFLTYQLTAVEMSLKSKMISRDGKIVLSDIINEKVEDDIAGLKIADISSFPYRLRNDEVLARLIENGYRELILKGKEIIIYQNDPDDEITKPHNGNLTDKKDALTFLEESLSSYIDATRYRIRIGATRIDPSIDLKNVNENFIWVMDKFKYGLKDIASIKKLVLKVDNKNYSVDLDVKVLADANIARRNFKKGELFNNDFLKAKSIDLTLYKNPEDIVVDGSKTYKYRFACNIGTGEVLRWSDLDRNPPVSKNQSLKILIEKNGFSITVNCTALEDCFDNEKIKIRLDNGREKTGILRNKNGEYHVELL